MATRYPLLDTVRTALTSTAVGRAVLAAVDAAAARAAIGASPERVATYYADSFTVEAGSESASKSGTGETSTITLGASATARTYGTAGATAARAVLEIPAGTREVEVEIQVTAASGLSTGGWRYVACALRNAANGGAPSVLWGVGVHDGGSYWAANLMGGANSGHQTGSVQSAPVAADRWWRVQFKPREAFLSQMTGLGSAGARPSTWSPPGTAIPLPVHNTNSVFTPDTASAYALAIYLVSPAGGTGGASSLTARVTVRMVSQ